MHQIRVLEILIEINNIFYLTTTTIRIPNLPKKINSRDSSELFPFVFVKTFLATKYWTVEWFNALITLLLLQTWCTTFLDFDSLRFFFISFQNSICFSFFLFHSSYTFPIIFTFRPTSFHCSLFVLKIMAILFVLSPYYQVMSHEWFISYDTSDILKNTIITDVIFLFHHGMYISTKEVYIPYRKLFEQ